MVGKVISVMYIDSYQNINPGIKTVRNNQTGEVTSEVDNGGIRYHIVDTTFINLIDKINTSVNFFFHPGKFYMYNWMGLKLPAMPTYKMG